MREMRMNRQTALLLFVSILAAGCGEDNSPGPSNHSPSIVSLTATPNRVRTSGVSSIVCEAADPDGDSLRYEWVAQAGSLSDGSDSVSWTAPDAPGRYKILVVVTDGRYGVDTDSINVSVVVAVPEILSLTADPDLVAPGETVALVCATDDPGPDTLLFSWSADAGTFSGSGSSVEWTAPSAEGVHEIRVTVDNGKGGVARGAVRVDVFGGTFLVRTSGGLVAVRMDGASFSFAPSTAPVEVAGTRIFVKGDRSITELDHFGLPLSTITSTNPAVSGADFSMPPDLSFVFLDNAGDKMHFIDSDGSFYDTVLMPEASPGVLQHTSAVLVGNRLVVSETGTSKLIGVDLVDLAVSIFRSFDPGLGPLGPIDHSDGVYYLCRSQRIHRFTESGATEDLAELPAGSITGMVALGRYIYLVVSPEGTLRRVNIQKGEVELFADGLDDPREIEYVPVLLQP